MLARSERLVLRRFRIGDLSRFQAYRTDPEISRYQSWSAMTDQEARAFLVAMAGVPSPLNAGHWTQIAVASPNDDTLMGDLGLHLSDDGSEAEIGITLARAFHGRGLGTEAMRMAIDLVFDRAPVERIICGADRRNTASLAMIRRLGFEWTHAEPVTGPEDGTASVDDMFALERSRYFA